MSNTTRALLAALIISALAITAALVSKQSAAIAQSPSAPETVRIGYVDMQRVLGEVQEATQARERLERELAQRQERLDRDQQSFVEYAQELEASIAMLNEDAQRERMAEYQQRMGELQQRYAALQRELAELETSATAEILDRMVTISGQIARENNLTMMIEKNSAGILFSVDGLDFTDELVRRANATP